MTISTQNAVGTNDHFKPRMPQEQMINSSHQRRNLIPFLKMNLGAPYFIFLLVLFLYFFSFLPSFFPPNFLSFYSSFLPFFRFLNHCKGISLKVQPLTCEIPALQNYSPKAHLAAYKLKFPHQSSITSLDAPLQASRLKHQPHGSSTSLMAQVPASMLPCNLPGSSACLKTQAPSSRLKYQPQCSPAIFQAQVPAS